jgi:beta-lactamase class A
MKYDQNLPLKARLAKRRRQKRARFLILLMLITLIVFSSLVKQLPVKRQADTDSAVRSYMDSMKQVLSLERPYAKESLDSLYGQIDEKASNGESVTASGEIESIVNTHNSIKLNELKNDIESYIKSFKGKYGIYYINLVDDSEFGVNDKDEYIAASTVKIPINLYLYNKIKDGSVDADGVMPYLEEDYEGGTGKLQFDEIGKKYTVRELSKLSIEISDNVATNILLRLLGRYNIKEYMRRLGGIVISDERNISCPRDMALYMKQVYYFYKSSGDLGEELMGYFQNTVFKDRIPGQLPKSIKIAHKIGNQTDAYHDVGIVFAKKPYVIAIMSENIKEREEAFNVIANISKKVYDFVSEK